MPATIHQALQFLETQWSSINDNKIKGILAEIRLRSFLTAQNTYFGPGGWIVTPGNPEKIDVPPAHKICLIPRGEKFSWVSKSTNLPTPTLAEISAYNYFRQVGISSYFVEPRAPDEALFELPRRSTKKERAYYPRPYKLDLKIMGSSNSLQVAPPSVVFGRFAARKGNIGLRCNSGKINSSVSPWDNKEVVAELFWFEYARYYFQIDYIVSNNDLDMYLVGQSGLAYPVELKSKSVASDSALGDWFGIDMGPFAKLAFFTANGMNTDALYIVEEMDGSGQFVCWLGIRYTDLVKACSWVGRSGGTGMMGGSSSTYKVPKAAFSPLLSLLADL